MRNLLILAGLALAACGSEVETPAPGTANGYALATAGYPTAAAFLSCLEGQSAIVSAHRGGPVPGYPENAIETFERTLSLVPALIETDVRETRDGVLVLLHDETVDRTTNGSGAVAEMTIDEVRQLRLVDEEGQLTEYRVPTLAEALEAMRGRTILQLDVKRGVGLRQVIGAVAAAGAEADAAIITYTDNGAVIVAEAGLDLSVFATVEDSEHLAALEARGVRSGQLVAWTGISGEPQTELYAMLGARDISASGGTLGGLDNMAARQGGEFYRRLEEAGLDIIATDRPIAAARAIGTEELEAAIGRCERS